jgi:DNA-directed RNA polymerase subunit RPC12/RpoP
MEMAAQAQKQKCPQCSGRMTLTMHLPATRTLPVLQGFQCVRCGRSFVFEDEELDVHQRPDRS